MCISDKYIIILIVASGFFSSCKTLEKASIHGLTSGFYTLKTENKNVQGVYVDLTNEQIDVYHQKNKQPDKKPLLTIPLETRDSAIVKEMIFKKESLDIDITSILLKYRPPIRGLPPQLNTDLNIALYVGWRYDNYRVVSKKDPLNRMHPKIDNMGFDFGFFAGPGTTMINPFTTNYRRTDDYSGMIIQTGFAGFFESNLASFGLSVGYDYLLNPDYKNWIYQNKPWVGFIVGIALN